MRYDEETLTEAVRGAWEASLPATPFDPRASWRDIGLNSLTALELIARLEQTLGRTVGFDDMTPHHTAADLIGALVRKTGAQPGAQPGAHWVAHGGMDEQRYRVFMIPGVFGDEPTLAQLRHALSGEVSFEVLAMPGFDAPLELLDDIPGIAAYLAEEVLRRHPGGGIRLTGFSFGALLAQEMACQLTAKGHDVVFLALLDGLLQVNAPPADMRAISRDLRTVLRSRQDWTWLRDRAIFSALRRLNAWGLARRFLLRVAARHDPSWSRERDNWLIGRGRYLAMRRWRPQVCATPTLLVISELPAAQASVERWRAMCPHLRVTPIPSGHNHMFEPAALSVLVPAFNAALAEFGAAGP